MRCGGFSMIGTEGKEAGVYPLRCKRWACQTCGPRKARATMKRLRAGMALGEVRFFTLTSPGDEDAETTYAKFPARWKRLHERVARRFGRIEYLGVVEPQPRRGAAHFHVVYRGPFIPQAWLSRTAAECGFGRIADIRRANPRLVTYLVKYLTKELATADRDGAARRGGPPKYFRRVRWSRGWCTWNRREPSRWKCWWFVDAVPSHAAIDARNRGYQVVELDEGDQTRSFHPGRRLRWLREVPRRPRVTAFAEFFRTRGAQRWAETARS